ncbi:MAG: cell division protein FtsZ [Candidatus Limnocylindria bacterium]
MDYPLNVVLPAAAAAVALLAIAMILVGTRRRRSGRVVRVVGVGGGGVNAVDAMIRARMKGADYVAVNTDRRSLNRSAAGTKIAIGGTLTNGQGAGGDVSAGESAARQAADEIGRALAGSELVLIMAGLGGGTGSGAAPVVAEIARQQGALTMAVVTQPFGFEGARRHDVAQRAGAALVGKVDAVATVPNDRVREIMPADVTAEDAFRAIDDVMHRNVSEILDLIAIPGRINLDFADVKAVLQGGGAAAVGFGRATGENRAIEAARKAIAATLLQRRMQGAKSVLVNVSGSRSLKLAELDAVAETVLAATGKDANLQFGMSVQPGLRDEVQVTLIATGHDQPQPGDAAGAAPWRPVWLRRAEEAAAPSQPAPQVIVQPKRRERRAAGRAAAETGAATSLPASPESDVQG